MKKYVLLAISFLIMFLGIGLAISSPSAHAQSGFNYTDHLMDDAVFRASNTMSATDIQTFLVNMGSGLVNVRDTEDCTSSSHPTYFAQYYTCNTSQLASKIIYDVSQAYGINPQVILATLQKEQSLVTTVNPTSSQINYAMGYGCPDSGGCSQALAGFFTQVDIATWQFRFDYERLTGNNTWWNNTTPYPCSTSTRYYSQPLLVGNNVTFKDDAGTGYATFVLPNASTATLYCYTPHVYPGSSQQYYSGSYWFVYYFNLWFVPYSWQMMSQYAYTDANSHISVDINNIAPGQKIYAGFTAKNNGNVTWQNSGPNAMMVGTAGPLERTSAFSTGSSWLTGTRPALLKETSVAPGQIGTFEFVMTAPSAPGQGGIYNERFNILSNGITWFNDVGLSFYLNVKPATYSWQMMSQYAYTDATSHIPIDMANLRSGDKVYVGFTAKNTGNVTWSNSGANPIRVGTLSPIERSSIFAPGSDWLGSSRPGKLIEANVPPLSIGTFEFWLTVPNNPGTYNERFGLVTEGRSWLNDVGLSYYARIL